MSSAKTAPFTQVTQDASKADARLISWRKVNDFKDS